MKRTLALFLSIVMMLSVVSISSVGTYAAETDTTTVGVKYYTSGDYVYTVSDDGTAEIADYKGTATQLQIPSTLGQYTVTSIGNYSFSKTSSLTEVIIPDTVTNIGIYGFSVCSALTSITIPDSVKSIGDSAFHSCSALLEIVIPDSVTVIGDKAFYDCTGLTSITIGDSVESIGTSAFENCKNVTGVTIPASVNSIGDYAFYKGFKLASATIENGVETIGAYAFGSCSKLSSVVIPDSVESIGNCAFYDCPKITSITIGKSLKSLGDSAFTGSYDLLSINIDSENTAYDSRNDSSAIIETATDTLILGSANSVIPDSVKIIDSFAFYHCNGITSINIPDSVVSIGNYAFAECKNLSGVTMGDAVESIGERAFYYCYKLTSITISASLKTVGDYAFADCQRISSIVLPDSVTSIGNSVFSGCYGLESVEIGNAVESIGEWAFGSCYGMTAFVIPSTVKNIGEYAFYRCAALKSMEIPASVTSIGIGAFSGCDNLASIIVDSENLVYDSRDNCNAIIKTDSNTLVMGCYNTVIPVSVTNIGNRAFYNCFNLNSIDIPDSVLTIGDEAFALCLRLSQVTLPQSVTAIGNYAFSGCYVLSLDTVPESVKTIGDYAFRGCYNLTSFTVPVSVEKIGDGAFNSCHNLSAVKIMNPDCEISDSPIVIDNTTAIYGYDDSTANEYAVKYDKTFVSLSKVSNVRCTEITDNSFLVEWDELDNAEKYYIYVDGVSYGSSTTTSRQVVNRNSAQTYKVYVIAKLSDGTWLNTEDADVVEVTTLQSKDAYIKVENLKVDSVSAFELTISWDDNDEAVGYWVYANDVSYVYTENSTLTLTKRTPETLYNLCVVAKFANGKLQDKTLADVVTVTTEAMGEIVSTTGYDFPIPEDVKSADKAWILYGESAEKLVVFQTVNVAEDSFRIANLKYNTQYYYAFLYMKNGKAHQTEPLSVTTEANDTYNVITATKKGSAVELSWNQVNNAYKYWVFKNGKLLKSAADTTFTLTSYDSDDVITIEATYKYQLGTRQFKYEPLKLSDVLK